MSQSGCVRAAVAVDYLSTVDNNDTDSNPPPPLLSPHGRLLTAIHHKPGLTQTEYGERIGLSRRTIIRLLNDLEQAGYVTTQATQTALTIEINGDTKLPGGTALGGWLKRHKQ